MSERTTYLMKQWRDRALAAEADRQDEEDRANENATLVHEARARLSTAWAEGYLRGTLDATSDLEPADNPYENPEGVAAPSAERGHHPDCPARYFADHPERCRCLFLSALDRLEP